MGDNDATYEQPETHRQEDNLENFWQINEFSKKVGAHYNTVDTWFKRLEDKGLHYIVRTKPNNQKVYDIDDLQIALFIKEKRDARYLLDVIFDLLPEHFVLRPFPDDKNKYAVGTPEDVYSQLELNLKKQLKQDVDEIEENFKRYMQEMQQIQQDILEKQQLQDTILKSLPQPVDKEVERQRRFDEAVALYRVRAELEKEAAAKWMQLDEKERTKRVGIIFKTEDTNRKNTFISQYVNEHFEERLKSKFDI